MIIKLIKIIAILLILFLAYYIVSVKIGITDLNGHHNYFYSNWSDVSSTKAAAIEKGLFISNKNFRKEVVSDSLRIFDSIEFWTSKIVVHNNYGFLPIFHFVDTATEYCELNILSLKMDKEGDLINFSDISSHDQSRGGNFEYLKHQSLRCKLPHDTLPIEFVKFIDFDHEYKIGFVKLSW
jgi:hypothetical protein